VVRVTSTLFLLLTVGPLTETSQKILALEPYYGGSHRAFLDGWISRSRHTWTLLTLPANKWKWRMRHGPVTLSNEVRRRSECGERWDLVFCSDMLNFAEFLGLAPAAVRTVPSIAYFHENQVTYPVQHKKEYDYHFAFSNMTTALAASRVWFNSEFNRDSFVNGLRDFLERMPDFQPLADVDRIHGKSIIRPPGIDSMPTRGPRVPGPLRILWAARWEFDKNPADFFAALDLLERRGLDFEVSVIGGGQAARILPEFEEAQSRFRDRIRDWGYLDSRDAYLKALLESDVAVSTANHEFFGVGMAEACAAGAYPLVPNRLAYPELLAAAGARGSEMFFYDGSAGDLAIRLAELHARLEVGDLWAGSPGLAIEAVDRFQWDRLVETWDDELAAMID